jgi:predicted nucleic acid-binding protein
MRILDTNIFLRAITEPATPADRRMQVLSQQLFERVINGDEEVITCEAVLHEVFYLLCSPRSYGLEHNEAVARVRLAFDEPGFHIARKQTVSKAIDFFRDRPALDFTDCLLALYAEEDDHELTTFDRGLAREAGVEVYSPKGVSL